MEGIGSFYCGVIYLFVLGFGVLGGGNLERKLGFEN